MLDGISLEPTRSWFKEQNLTASLFDPLLTPQLALSGPHVVGISKSIASSLLFAMMGS